MMTGPHRPRRRAASAVRAVRGATTVAADEPCLVREATAELLCAMLAENALDRTCVLSAIFTVTTDLRSEFPARAARGLGWDDVPLLCAQEVPVPGALPRCIRALLHVATSCPRSAVRHVYLREAVALRPDLAAGSREGAASAPLAARLDALLDAALDGAPAGGRP